MTRRLLPLFALLFCLPAGAQTAKEAKTFVAGIYGSFRGEGPDLYGKGAEAILTSAFAKALLVDRQGAQTLNYEPFCACLEPRKTQFAGVSVELQTSALAIAQVSINESNGDRMKLRLVLLWTEAGWRVDDISTKDTPSLRRTLTPPAQ